MKNYWILKLSCWLVIALMVCGHSVSAADRSRQSRQRNNVEVAENEEEAAEDTAAEVLSQNTNYRDLFKSTVNASIPLARYVSPGENLKYQAKWKGLPAGFIQLTAKRQGVVRGRPVMVFELACETNDFVAAFYPINTIANSYVDAHSGRSYLLRRRVSERRRQYKDRFEFEYDSRLPNGLPNPVARYSRIGDKGEEVAHTPKPIPGDMQDTLSVIYYLRGLDLNKTGDVANILLGGRKQVSILSIEVVGEERVTVPDIGTFDALILSPKGDGSNQVANIIATQGEEKIWVEKHTKIPLMMTAELPKPVGQVVATLVEADNSVLKRYAVPPQ